MNASLKPVKKVLTTGARNLLPALVLLFWVLLLLDILYWFLRYDLIH